MFFNYSKKRKLCLDIAHAYHDRFFQEVKELVESGRVDEYEQHKETRAILNSFGVSASRKYVPEANFLWHCANESNRYEALGHSLRAIFLKKTRLEQKLAHIPKEKPHHPRVEPLISPPVLEKLQQVESPSEAVIG